eukprot:1975793-Pleurochrysis_carterae.AAC.1
MCALKLRARVIGGTIVVQEINRLCARDSKYYGLRKRSKAGRQGRSGIWRCRSAPRRRAAALEAIPYMGCAHRSV